MPYNDNIPEPKRHRRKYDEIIFVNAGGKPYSVKPGRKEEDAEERFWAKVNRNGPIPKEAPHLGSCWIWTGPIWRMNGYGAFWFKGRQWRVHRWAMFHFVGPSKLTVDHLCFNRQCVNYEGHLVYATSAEQRNRRQKYSCGHELRKGLEQCRICTKTNTKIAT